MPEFSVEFHRDEKHGEYFTLTFYSGGRPTIFPRNRFTEAEALEETARRGVPKEQADHEIRSARLKYDNPVLR